MTTAATRERPLCERDPNLYKRLFEITMNPGYSEGFKALARDAAFYERKIAPADLSTEEIRTVLLESATKERNARRKRERAGKKTKGFWPPIFDAFIDTAANGCRFEKWCRGDCAPGLPGDRAHWSVGGSITELTYGDTLGVDVFQIENPDGSLEPVQIIISYESADDAFQPVDVHLSPTEARKVGDTVQAAADRKTRPNRKTGTILDLTFESGDRLVFAGVPRRTRRDGSTDVRCFEFTLQEVGSDVPVRFSDDYSGPWFLGRHLMRAADDAEGVVQLMTEGMQNAVQSVMAE